MEEGASDIGELWLEALLTATEGFLTDKKIRCYNGMLTISGDRTGLIPIYIDRKVIAATMDSDAPFVSLMECITDELGLRPDDEVDIGFELQMQASEE